MTMYPGGWSLTRDEMRRMSFAEWQELIDWVAYDASVSDEEIDEAVSGLNEEEQRQ